MPTIAELKTTVERIWQASCGSSLLDTLEQHLRERALAGVKATLEAALVEELNNYLGAPAYARSSARQAGQYRAGYFRRCVLTSFGAIEDLRVPKLRRGNADRHWQILQRYQRLAPHLLDQLLYVAQLGLSLRDLQELLYVFVGQTLSRSAINRISSVAQTSMQNWRAQAIDATPPILIIDGVWVNILYPTELTWTDRSGHIRQQVRVQERVILVAMAVWEDGRAYILDYMVAETEDKSSWQSFWQALRERGLKAEQVRMVVCDGSKGVLESLSTHLPKAKLQRCVVHKVRSFERKLCYGDLEQIDPATETLLSEEAARLQRRNAISAEALAIFQAESRGEAEARLSSFISNWQEREAAAVKTFLRGLKRCFSFYEFEPPLHPLIRSTNLLERFFREFRTRADEMGAFPNEASCLTVFHLVMVREHAKHDRIDFAQTA